MLYGSEQSVDTLNGALMSRRAKRRAERTCLAAFGGAIVLVGAILFWGPAIHGFFR